MREGGSVISRFQYLMLSSPSMIYRTNVNRAVIPGDSRTLQGSEGNISHCVRTDLLRIYHSEASLSKLRGSYTLN